MTWNADRIKANISLGLLMITTVAGCASYIRPHIVLSSDIKPLHEKIEHLRLQQREMRIDQLTSQIYMMDQVDESEKGELWTLTYHRLIRARAEIAKEISEETE